MPADDDPDDTADNAEGGPWMTYDELAAARGIDRQSAVKLALRHGWRKERDKFRVARVHVPPEWANGTRGKGPGRGPAAGGSPSPAEQMQGAAEARAAQSDQARAVERSMWQGLLAQEREHVDNVERERARLLTVIDSLERRVAAGEARADAAEEERRAAEARVDAERARTEALEQTVADERTRGDALREQAEAAERALEAECRRADALVGKIDELKGLLASVLRTLG